MTQTTQQLKWFRHTWINGNVYDFQSTDMQSALVFASKKFAEGGNVTELEDDMEIIFNIKGNHENHTGVATVTHNYNEGTVYALNNLPGDMDNMKTRKIGDSNGYSIYENYYDSGSNDYLYFAVKNAE